MLIGAVKITPGHDANDYDIGKRHNLRFITMMDESGMIRDVGDFKAGYKKFVVRLFIFGVKKSKDNICLYLLTKATNRLVYHQF